MHFRLMATTCFPVERPDRADKVVRGATKVKGRELGSNLDSEGVREQAGLAFKIANDLKK
jgi:hypothetical protein